MQVSCRAPSFTSPVDCRAISGDPHDPDSQRTGLSHGTAGGLSLSTTEARGELQLRADLEVLSAGRDEVTEEARQVEERIVEDHFRTLTKMAEEHQRS